MSHRLVGPPIHWKQAHSRRRQTPTQGPENEYLTCPLSPFFESSSSFVLVLVLVWGMGQRTMQNSPYLRSIHA